MPHETIERYLNKTLKPQLDTLDVEPALVQRALDTVREQMISCISHWNDEAFRKALLTVGMEEALFYKPKTDIEVRCFVVVTVRNSAIETLHTMTTSKGWQGKILSPEMIQEITSAAIEYFRTVDFSALAKEIGTLENDLYGRLADKYMLAWDALEQLGNSSSMKIKYATYVMDEDYAPTLDNLEKEQAGYTNKFNKADSTTATEELADGYALSINPGLMDNIENAFANKVPVIFDCFKGVSRNIEKLLTVMEYILGRKNFIVTTNYLISNGHIERRAKLLKPCHNMDEMIANWKNPAGLTAIHKWWLEVAARGH